MKDQRFIVLLLIILTFAACKQPATDATAETSETTDAMDVKETKDAMEAPDYAAFDEKVAIVRSFMRAHGSEDLEKQTELLSDTLKWSPPYYNGNEWLGKKDYLAVLKQYHADFENIEFAEGIVMTDTTAAGMWSGSVYPQDGASVSPDAIRIYGTWTAIHSATGKEIGVKWFGLSWFNEDGQIVAMTEYFDVNGIAAQIAE